MIRFGSFLLQESDGIWNDKHFFNKLYPNSDQEDELDDDNIQQIKKAYESGAAVPPIVAKSNGEIIEGHHRFAAAKQAGITPEIVVVDNNTFLHLRSKGHTLQNIEEIAQARIREARTFKT